MVSGFTKSIMREDPSRILIHLNLNSVDDGAPLILRVVNKFCNTPHTLTETDLLEENGVMYIPRIVEAPQINRLLDATLHGFQLRPVEVIGNEEEPIELRFTPGRLDSLHLGSDAVTGLGP
ncbi:hypothetical protein F4804DRAFT_4099 [Jackrogersella minutella]|nr:hypothetical protein F4804DRAFT_4099 [Jackrogersella minutella]